jgi:hypothetical protein
VVSKRRSQQLQPPSSSPAHHSCTRAALRRLGLSSAAAAARAPRCRRCCWSPLPHYPWSPCRGDTFGSGIYPSLRRGGTLARPNNLEVLSPTKISKSSSTFSLPDNSSPLSPLSLCTPRAAVVLFPTNFGTLRLPSYLQQPWCCRTTTTWSRTSPH